MPIGSLNLLGPVDIEHGMASLRVADLALDNVQRRGFVMPQPNAAGRYVGVMPADIVRLTDEQLGALLNDISSWLQYAETELAKARAFQNEVEAQYDFIRSRLRLAIKAAAERKLSNPEMDDMVRCDPRVVEAQRNMLYADAVHEYTKHLVEASQRDWDTVSRRITQRGQEIDRTNRGSNVGNIPVMSSAFRR